MDIPQLTPVVQRYFQQHAARFGLNADTLQVSYVLNWGGFENASFTLADGRSSLHAKLTHQTDHKQRFRRWHRFHQILESRYHAPPLIDWIALPDTDYAGLLFHHIEAQPICFTKYPSLLNEVMDATSALHADSELALQLQPLDSPRNHRDCFLDTYIERFDADLRIIQSCCPPFVSAKTMQWMQQETRRLEALAWDKQAFSTIAAAPTHGDLHRDNILVTVNRQWYIVDWDGLSMGDPALDYAILLWPLLYGDNQRSWLEFRLPHNDAHFAQRMELYLRAQLLDMVIDVLADYVEAGVAPDHQAHAREKKRQEHLEALDVYHEEYG